jgi:ribosome recycling factor
VSDPDVDDIERRMNGAIEALKREFSTLRTGRASASILDQVKVDAYGTPTPINQVGSINVPEARMISVQVWDKSLVKAVEVAIRDADLGLNPSADGQLVRVPLPDLTEERRTEMGKIASKYAEQARVAVRNVRRDGMDELKKMEKAHDMSEDDHKVWADEFQKMTDTQVAEIDRMFESKHAEIMQV